MLTQESFRIFYLITMLFLSTAVNAGQNWEYLAKTYPLLGNDAALTTTLNHLGEQQWELVNCTEGDAQLTCIFKRQAATRQ
ncbi:MAG: hypothetical protein QNK24_14065 [Desulfuromusa sp.]|nr:hypothetical protein [Desulfuromusa sp.]